MALERVVYSPTCERRDCNAETTALVVDPSSEERTVALCGAHAAEFLTLRDSLKALTTIVEDSSF